MRASFVNDSIHLRERAAEMRVSSKELKDNNTAAAIMRLAAPRPAFKEEQKGRRRRLIAARGMTAYTLSSFP